jgi:transcription initiation factor TFIIIB Brf1 subunit/transcription initiation factor TFIIB
MDLGKLLNPFTIYDELRFAAHQPKVTDETTMDEDESGNSEEEETEESVRLELATFMASMSGSISQPRVTAWVPATTPSTLVEKKVRRILTRVKKLARELCATGKIRGSPGILVTAREILETIPHNKILNKPINRTTAVVAYVAMKRERVRVEISQVVTALKTALGLSRLTRSVKQHQVCMEHLSVDMVATALETAIVSDGSPDARDRVADCQSTVTKLAHELKVGDAVLEKAMGYCQKSDDSSMASRHRATVASACLLLAAKKSKCKLTLERAAETAGASTCTVRKALKALVLLV